jgi:undecaprenyl-diphosphatase
VDVQPIGPDQSCVGLAAVNGFFDRLIGVHPLWLKIADVLGIVALLTAAAFAVIGLIQWIQRKKLFRVDGEILFLGLLYFAVICFYLLFEQFVINYRPILVGGVLEASYPSSHTMLAVSIMGSSLPAVKKLLSKRSIRLVWNSFAITVMTVTVLARWFSGVHWFTDIVAGLLLSLALIFLYQAALLRFCHQRQEKE